MIGPGCGQSLKSPFLKKLTEQTSLPNEIRHLRIGEHCRQPALDGEIFVRLIEELKRAGQIGRSTGPSAMTAFD
jgi:hypothetical protein